MPILRLEIDDIKYDVECKEGEEKLLREFEQLLKNKFEPVILKDRFHQN